MDSIERLKYQLAFDFLAPSIEGQKNMTPAYQAHIETARGLLEEIAEGLEFIVPPEQEVSAVAEGRTFQAGGGDFTDILRLQGYNPSSLTRKQVSDLAKYFRTRIGLFEKLTENPEAVYGKFHDRVRLLNMCEDFRKFYAENHQVLKCAESSFEEDELFLPAHGRDDGNAD